MTISSSLTLLLGTSADNAKDDEIGVRTAQDFASIRSKQAPASLSLLRLVVDSSEFEDMYNPMELSGWTQLLRPGTGRVEVCVRGALDGSAPLQPIHTSFLLAGLMPSGEQRKGAGDGENSARVCVVTATRPSTAPSITSEPIRAATRISVNLEEEDDLIDEDDLLGEAPVPPSMSATKASGDDCGGRKPCDDCTCGRAEREAGAEKAPKQQLPPTSSCGNCAKGDAFRCASCPFLGKPAFKPGEEHLVLDLTDDL